MGLGVRTRIAAQAGLAAGGLILFAPSAIAACTSLDPTPTVTSTGNSVIVGDQAFIIAPSTGLYFDDSIPGGASSAVITNGVVVDSTGTGDPGIEINGQYDLCYDGLASGSIVSDGAGMAINLTDGDVLLNIAHGITAGAAGVMVTHFGSGLIDIDVDTIEAGEAGILVGRNSGTGTTRITANGMIDAVGPGIFALIDPFSTGDLEITANAGITSDDSGIAAVHYGDGDVTITTLAGTTIEAHGITDLDIYALGPSFDASVGIYVDRSGTTGSDVTITNGANIDVDGVGMYIDVCSCIDSDLLVNSTGTIDVNTGYGIYVSKGATGSTTVNQSGKVTVQNGTGVHIDQFEDGNVVASLTGGVEATDTGLIINHAAAGSVTVTAGGTYDISAGTGIEVYHDGDGVVDITSTATINSDWDAIYVEHNDGPTTVRQTGKLTVADGSGILVEQFGSGDVLATMVGDIDVSDTGIGVTHDGEDGIITITTSAGSTIRANGSFMGGAGIMANRSHFGPGTGTGGIIIDNRARIETDAIGIFASVCGCTPGNISISSAGAIDIDGPSGGVGVLVFHDGNGTISINTPGGIDVAGPGPGIGINVTKAGGGTIDIASGDISASAAGMIVQSIDDADLIVNANGSIDAPAGIVAIMGGDATVTVADTITAEEGVTLVANTITGTIAAGAAINVTGTGPGRFGLSADSTLSKVTVGGTIDAAGTDAILFTGGDAQLTLLPGFVIDGQVDALASATNQLILGGDAGNGSFDLDRLGTAFTDFDTYLKTGASTWTLTGDAFTGLLTASGGTVVINDTIAGLDLSLTGTTLKGNAAIRSLVANSAVIAPGNSIGTVTVAGDVAIAGATVYDVEVNAAGASDKIVAGGAATLAATASVGVTMEPGTYGAVTKYTILSAAGGVTGAFDPDVAFSSAFFDAALSYDPNNVFLTLTRNSLTLGDFAKTPNQEATADALEDAGLGAPYFDELFVLPADEVPGALDAISGDGYASLTAAALDDGRFVREAALDRRGARGIWATPYGGIAHLPGDGNGPAVDHATGGLLLGADGEVGDGWLGVLLGYGQSRYDIAERDMDAASSEFSLGTYGGAQWDAFYTSFGAAITGRDIDATRRVVFPGVSDTFTPDYASLTAQAFAELGYRLDMGGTSVTPFGGLALLGATTSGYTESGTGAGALTVAPSAATALVATLGLRLEHEIALENERTLTLRASAAWRHAIGGASTRNSAAGTGTFTVAGAPLPADTLAVSAGTTLDLGQVTVGVDYTGSLGSGGFANAATATLAGTF